MTTIQLKKYGKSFTTRPFAHEIFANLQDDQVIVDFTAVEMATPSFCHEMLSELLQKNIKINVKNISPVVASQLKKAMASLDSK